MRPSIECGSPKEKKNTQGTWINFSGYKNNCTQKPKILEQYSQWHQTQINQWWNVQQICKIGTD